MSIKRSKSSKDIGMHIYSKADTDKIPERNPFLLNDIMIIKTTADNNGTNKYFTSLSKCMPVANNKPSHDNANNCKMETNQVGKFVCGNMFLMSLKYSCKHKVCIAAINITNAHSFHNNPVSIIAANTIALPVRVRNVGMCKAILWFKIQK